MRNFLTVHQFFKSEISLIYSKKSSYILKNYLCEEILTAKTLKRKKNNDFLKKVGNKMTLRNI